MIEEKKEFVCLICNKTFERKWNLDRHLEKKNNCLPIDEQKYKCNYCGKIFNKHSNFVAHLNKKNKCKDEKEDDDENTNIQTLADIMREILNNQNNMKLELKNETKLADYSHNTNTQNIENSHNTQTITNSNNTMHGMNNSCLINYVINNYPNAKNIEDCIKLENIPKSTLIECEDLYFTDGAMKIFKGLCDIGEENRPIHCTDASRCNYIYKTNDVWKIDVGGEAIRNYFFPVIQDAYTQVHKKRIKDNPGNSLVIGNYLTEMTGTNVKKICQKTLKKLSNDFLAKNNKNSKLMAKQLKRIEK